MKNQLQKIFSNQFYLIVTWVLYLGTFVMSFGRYKHILNEFDAPTLIVYILSIGWKISAFAGIIYLIVLITWSYLYFSGKSIKVTNIPFLFVGGMSIVLFFLASNFVHIENINYGNFLYSKYGITKNSFEFLSQVSLITSLIFGIFVFNEKSRIKIQSWNNILSSSQVFSLFLLLIPVWYSIQSLMNIQNYLYYSKLTYDKEFENYSSIIELSQSVVGKKKIIIPPQSSKFPDISNGPIARYFLFPKILISSSYIDSQEKADDISEAYYVTLMDKDKNRWPLVDMKNRTILFQENVYLKYKNLERVNMGDEPSVFKIYFK